MTYDKSKPLKTVHITIFFFLSEVILRLFRIWKNYFSLNKLLGTIYECHFSGKSLIISLQVIEHVYEKVMNGGSEGGSGAGTPTGSGKHKRTNYPCIQFSFSGDRGHGERTGAEAESGSLAEERVELLCNDTMLDPNMDLRYVVLISHYPNFPETFTTFLFSEDGGCSLF